MYQDCSYKYKLHYIERLRSIHIGSALFFGSAFDEALNSLLLTKKKVLTEEEKELVKINAFDLFDEKFTSMEYNYEQMELKKSDKTQYFASDYDFGVLLEEDGPDICSYAKTLEMGLEKLSDVKEFMDECKEMRKNKKELDSKEFLLYNYICWVSLRRKGHLMIEEYRNQILPQIEEVFEIQSPVSLLDNGDEFRGFIDFVASFSDEPNVKYVIDNKTSSRKYPDNAVLESDQLAAYSEYAQIKDCAYIVVEKGIRKREPRLRSQILRDKIPQENVDKVFDKISDVFYNIQDEKFEKVFEQEGKDKNDCFHYGRKCPYYDYCRTEDLKGLKYVKV
jgi:hypothetical protein